VRKWIVAEGAAAGLGDLAKLGVYCVAHSRGTWLVRNIDAVIKGTAPTQRDLNSNEFSGYEIGQGVIAWSVANGED